MTVRRIDQGMAGAAARALPASVDKELRTRLRQLRVMLHSAGLAATYAFIAAKSKDNAGEGPRDDLAQAYQRVAEELRGRLADRRLLPHDARQMSAAQVMAALADMDPVRYARASAEASAFAGWLARLADAVFLEGGSGA
jgi:CRISPR type III-B/RAMP module-associated protein Cmr5